MILVWNIDEKVEKCGTSYNQVRGMSLTSNGTLYITVRRKLVLHVACHKTKHKIINNEKKKNN